MGAQGVLVLPSYYCKPNQEEIFNHFASIADAVDIPVMVYNNPSTTGVDIQPQTVARMANYHPNLCYIKECTGDIKRLRDIQLLCGDKIKVFCGWEDLAFESFASGAVGWISVIGNIVPGMAAQLFNETAGQKDLHKGWNIYKPMLPMLRFLEYSGRAVQTLKYCLDRMQQTGGAARLPRLPLSDEDKKGIDKMLEELNLV
jgi:4-hydroxy-tetrahydrodipicolinate synthase